MRDKDLYARILDIEAPWRVADVGCSKARFARKYSVVHLLRLLTCTGGGTLKPSLENLAVHTGEASASKHDRTA